MENGIEWFLTFILVLSSLGVILAKKPVYSGLSFLLTLLTLSAFYLQLQAEFTAVMQILVYAGAILVIFMFVIILFQDAYIKIENTPGLSSRTLLLIGALSFLSIGAYFAARLSPLLTSNNLSEGFGSVQALGKLLFLDYFFPFEAVILIFLVAVVGSIYIGKKEI